MRILIQLLIVLLVVPNLVAQNEDQSLAPYFRVNAKEGDGTETLPLRSTSAEVNIAGVIADVVVTQVYENTGQVPIEAIYVFPGSTRSAVYGMQMKIGQRIIEAEIKEKQAARETYEAAKQEGKRASLLEQERPNVFQMNVANILPGDRVEVQLRYTELLIPEDGAYQFVYPTIVGPRYTDGSESRNDGYTAMPYTTMGAAPLYDFDLKVYLDGGMPLQEVSSKTHDISVRPASGTAVNIDLLAEESKSANRDFILDYSFQGNEIQTGILVFDDGDEQFFLCMAQPPKAVDADLIPPREYIFLMDVSGSMRGFPLSVSKSLMRQLIGQLRPEDAFNIMVFAGGNQWWSTESVTASSENLQAAEQFLNTLSGGGGTSLLPALKQCLALPRYREDVARSIIVVSDGYVSVEDEAFQLVRDNLNEANLFSFGIGSSVNRHLMEGLARAGQGQPFIVTDQEAAEVAATKLSRYIEQPLFTQIDASFTGGFHAYDLEPSTLPDVLSERPVLLFGKFTGEAQGEIVLEGYSRVKTEEVAGFWPFRKAEPAQVKSQRVSMRIDVSKAHHSPRNAALKYLWAREKIRNLSDFKMYGMSDADRQETLELGLKYNLLTNFTSFVAVEKEVSNDDPTKLVPVKQPLPLPQGVSNEAIGFELELFGISGTEFLPQKQNAWTWLILFLLAIGTGALVFWKLRYRGIGLVLIIGLGATLTSCETEQGSIEPQPFDEVTFILGEDRKKSNTYFASALHYFSTNQQAHTPLIEKECRSLEEVIQYLRQNPPQSGAWQTINLVVHGNEWTGINLSVIADGPRCSPDLLDQLVENPAWEPLPVDLVNDCTTINIIGCNVGKNEALMQRFREVIAGQRLDGPSIRSARHFNIFRQQEGGMKRMLAESCFVNFKAGQFPGNHWLAEQFEQKYPDHDTDWQHALLTLGLGDSPQPYVHYFNIPVEWMVVYPDEASRPNLSEEETTVWAEQQEDLNKAVTQMGFTMDDFRWTTTPTTIQGKPALQVEGQTIIYCILHPLQPDAGDDGQFAYQDDYFAVVP
mgnify:CR=1 FL=1